MADRAGVRTEKYERENQELHFRCVKFEMSFGHLGVVLLKQLDV